MHKKVQFLFQGIFFLLVLLLVYLALNPELIFHQQQLGFLSDAYVWHEYLSYPGGLADYLSIFLLQFTSIRFLGAVMFAVLLTAIAGVYGRVLNQNTNSKPSGIQYWPLIILAVLLSNYTYLVFFPFIYLMIGILLLVLKNGVLFTKKQWISSAGLLLTLTLSYYLLGGFGFLILGTSILLLILVHGNHNWLNISIIALSMLFVPWLAAKFVFFITLHNAYFLFQPYLSEYHPGLLDFILFFTIPGLIVLIRIMPQKVLLFLNKRTVYTMHFVLILMAFAVLFVSNINQAKKLKLDVGHMALNKQWDKLLVTVKEQASDDRVIAFQTNRALYFTGKMTTDLFAYKQKWGIDGLLISRVFNEEVLLPTTELYNDWGYVNEAIHWGNEAVSFRDKSPQIIEQLIIAHIIENDMQAAKLYVNILNKFPFFRKKANYYDVMIQQNKIPETLLDKRKLKPVNDFVAGTFPEPAELLNLLNDHPENKMVYEYLMSYYLLNNDVISFVKNYGRGKVFNYGSVPRIYMEAIVLYVYNQTSTGQAVPNFKLDSEVVADFKDYLAIVRNMKGQLEIAQPILKDKYGSTYWYYVNFDSPITNKLHISTQSERKTK
ncbi:MAG: DUF6057 family protein [Prolixibacteraceae bacterium]